MLSGAGAGKSPLTAMDISNRVKCLTPLTGIRRSMAVLDNEY